MASGGTGRRTNPLSCVEEDNSGVVKACTDHLSLPDEVYRVSCGLNYPSFTSNNAFPYSQMCRTGYALVTDVGKLLWSLVPSGMNSCREDIRVGVQ